MQFSIIAVAAVLASTVSAHYYGHGYQNSTAPHSTGYGGHGHGGHSGHYTTVTQDTYETVCPYETTITYGHETITATAGQTVTLTHGPYTVTKPVYETATSVAPTTLGTAPAHVVASTGYAAPTTYSAPNAPAFTGAANTLKGSYAAVAGIAAVAVLFL